MSRQDKKKGRVEVVARTGGIKFQGEDKWYNPTKEAKDSVKREFKGREVEIELSDVEKNIFSSIAVASAETSQKNDQPYQELIVRQTCLKAATEMVCAELQKNSVTSEFSVNRILDVATAMEKWVWKRG